jgi:hypothetical protein
VLLLSWLSTPVVLKLAAHLPLFFIALTGDRLLSMDGPEFDGYVVWCVPL